MRIVAVTGGIASGKSTAAKALADRLGGAWVSCDDLVDALYRREYVTNAIRERFGSRVFPGGKLDRKVLGGIIFTDEAARKGLEGIFHPLVLLGVDTWRRDLEGAGVADWGVVEVPLLYEVDFPLRRDIDVVVGCSLSTQLERIERRDQLGEEQARRRISAQWPIEQKVVRGDVVLWNDGAKAVLEQLAGLAANRIQGIR